MTQKFYFLLHGEESYARSAYLYMQCRKKGITVRSTIDLLIVETVLENELLLLHNDNDFVNISKVITGLKFY
ncbi:MAG: DNA-binding protein [Spirochaetales bacterium]|nr:DNA-binding protein [Spirochaetales bacterium]